MLTEQQREELSAQLVAMRLLFEKRLRDLHQETRPVSLDQAVGRLTRIDMIQQQQMASGQQQRLDTELRQVAAAIERLSQNQYGVCLRCRDPISYERLKIRPITILCYECQHTSEVLSATNAEGCTDMTDRAARKDKP